MAEKTKKQPRKAVIYPIYNRALINGLLNRDDIYREIYQVDAWHPGLPSLQHAYFMVMEENTTKGVVVLAQESQTSISIHGGVFKKFRGHTTRMLKDILETLQEKSPTMVFWTKVASYNKAAQAIIAKTGGKQFGMLPGAVGKADLLFYKWETEVR